jgi:hypothetical protein
MRAPRVATLLAALAALAAQAEAGRKVEAPALSAELRHPSGAFTFRTPDGWKLVAVPGNSEAVETGDGTVALRFVFRKSEWGLDAMHAACMLERLAPPMDTQPQVQYEYDFIGGAVANRRLLDSAFAVHYDAPVRGARDWRQRNVTIVGEGQSLCVVSYVPQALWKKSAPTRVLVDAVLSSITFH